MQSSPTLFEFASQIQSLSSSLSTVLQRLARSPLSSQEFFSLTHQFARLACNRLATSCGIHLSPNEPMTSLLAKLTTFSPKFQAFANAIENMLTGNSHSDVERVCNYIIQLREVFLQQPYHSLWVGSLHMKASGHVLKKLAGPQCTSCFVKRSVWVENGKMARYAFLNFETNAATLAAFDKLLNLGFNVQLVYQ